jgi:sugar lactone lactonase YvrE
LITTNPADQTVNAGQTASFAVTASGSAPLSYQWRRGGAAIAGATASSYTTAATVATDSGATFDVVVSNTAGSVTSTTARLTVLTNTPPVLTITQPPQNATVTAGSTATFTVTATCTGATISYQWQRLPSGGQFVDIAGATASSYTTPATQATDNASQFRVNIVCGATSQTTAAALLTVTSPPVAQGVVLSLLPVGLAPAARLEQSAGIVREAAGSYLFADQWGLRRVSADLARVTTVVRNGTSVASAVDGPAATARVLNPVGVTVDSAGNAYISDAGTLTIRRVAPDGTLTTIAGSPGNSGSDDGAGAAARFAALGGIAIGPDGDLYVADTGNQRIRRVTAAGVVTTYAGSTAGYTDGAPNVARFGNPRGVAVATNGDVFVTDQANQRIRRIVRSGANAASVETLAGNGSASYLDGTGTAAAIASPWRIALAGSILYVSDGDGRVRRIDTATGVVTTLAGSPIVFPRLGPNDGTGTAATFDNLIGGYAANPDGSLLVSDRRHLRTVSAAGVVRTLGILNGQSGNLDVPPDGLLTDQADFLLGNNLGPAVVGDANGTAWIGDGYRWIRRVTSSGAVSAFVGLPGGECCLDGAGTEAQFGRIFALGRDAAGSLYVGDTFAIRRVQPNGATSLVAGNYGTFGAVDGLGSAARFNNPNGVAVDAAGNVFVADANAAIRRIDTTGNVTTFAGVMRQTGNIDGAPATARFAAPRQMTIANDGTLFVCDSNSLRRVATNGTVSTVTTAQGCTGPTFDTDGTLYFVAQGDSSAGLYRLRSGGSPERLLAVGTGGNDLAGTPQSLGAVVAMSTLAPRTLVILAGGQVLRAQLPQ